MPQIFSMIFQVSLLFDSGGAVLVVNLDAVAMMGQQVDRCGGPGTHSRDDTTFTYRS